MKTSPSLVAKGILAVATGNTEVASLEVGARTRQADGRDMLCPGGGLSFSIFNVNGISISIFNVKKKRL